MAFPDAAAMTWLMALRRLRSASIQRQHAALSDCPTLRLSDSQTLSSSGCVFDLSSSTRNALPSSMRRPIWILHETTEYVLLSISRGQEGQEGQEEEGLDKISR